MPTSQPSGRTRLNSEQMVNEIIALTNDIPGDVLESSLNPSQFAGSLATGHLEEQDFSLLGMSRCYCS